jgi:hypothetical protein
MRTLSRVKTEYTPSQKARRCRFVTFILLPLFTVLSAICRKNQVGIPVVSAVEDTGKGIALRSLSE